MKKTIIWNLTNIVLFKLPSFICKCFYVRVNVWLDDVIACVENVILLSSSEHINKWWLRIGYFTWLLERVWCVDCWLFSLMNLCIWIFAWFKSLIKGFHLSGSIRLLVLFLKLSEVDQPSKSFPYLRYPGIQFMSPQEESRNLILSFFKTIFKW